MNEKNDNFLPGEQPSSDAMLKSISAAAEGLVLISETDAEFTPFVWKTAEAITAEAVAAQAGLSDRQPVEEVEPAAFFAKLSTIQSWFGDAYKDKAARFGKLYTTLQSELTDLHVWRFGTVQIDIIIVGRSPEGNMCGVRTRAVET